MKMTDDILDIAKWKNKYPFLKNVSEVYDRFNNNEYVGTSRNSYYGLCHTIINKVDGNVEKHKDFCIKLMRNLGHHDAQTEYFKPSHDHCHILYNWIYNKIENSETPNKLIIECFNDYIDIMSHIPSKHNCSYDEFNSTYLEPKKITILKIFNDNIREIIGKLNEVYSSTDIPSQNFVCECVNIYKEMEKDRCTKVIETDNKHVQTCQMLKNFKTSYMEFFYKKLNKNDNIPSLDDVENEYKNKCLPHKPKFLLPASRNDDERASSSLAMHVDERKGEFSPPPPSIGENNGSSMSRTVSTAVGTMAGASSIIALLYKFTPGRNFIRSGFRGGRGRISNNLYAEQPNELFYDGFEGEHMSSYNPTYNVGYGSA